MTNNQLKYVIFAALFLVPFVPLVVSTSLFFPFITGKAFAFRLLVEIALVAYLVLAIRLPEYRPKFSWILVALTTFLVVMGLADFFGANSFKSFWSNYERMEGYITLLHLGAIFLVMGSVLKTEDLWNKLLATSLFASAIMAIYSFLQLAGKITINQGGVRVDGTFGNAAYLAIYMVFHIFIAAILFARNRGGWQKIVLVAIALADLIILYYTATRGAILGLLGGVAISLIFLTLKSNKGDRVRKFAVMSLVGLIVLGGLFMAVKNTTFVRENYVLSRFASLSTSDIEKQGRYFVWPIAVKGFLENPILGWGQEGFNFVFNKYYDPRMYTQEPWFDRAHSTPLDWLVAGGLLGLLSYLSIFVALLLYIFRAREEFLSKGDKAIILGLVSAYFFNNIFVFDQIGSYILFFTIIAYVHSHAPEVSPEFWQKISLKLRSILDSIKWRPILESSILIIFAFVLYFGNFLPWQQNKDLLAVLRAASQGSSSLAVYTKPLSGYGMGFAESLEHVSQAVINVVASPNTNPELKQQLFDKVDKAFVKHIDRVPEDARYRLFYGIFLSRLGWYGRAIPELEEARKLSPNKQGIYFELVSNQILDGKTKEALENAKHVYEIEPNFAEAKIVYALTALAAGDNATSAKLFGEIDEKTLVFDDRYITVLLTLQRFDQIIEVAKKRIVLDPGNLQHRITLTAAYLQAGRRAEAIQTIQEIINLEPSFKEKGEYYISEIKAGRNP